jgi:hypothetical protein
MDTISPIYIVAAALIAVIAIACFWLAGKKGSKGLLLGIAIVIWIIGQMIGSQATREMKIIGGTMATLGSIGFIVGLIDLFRKRKRDGENKAG